MSNALAVPSGLVVKSNKEELPSGGYLPFVVIQQKPKKNEPEVGHFVLQKGIGGAQLIDLDEEFHCLSFGWRSKAMFIDPQTKKVTSWFDRKVNADKFAKAEQMQAQGGMSGWMYGPEFLIYIPEQNEFATFFFSTKTLRNEAPNMAQLDGKNVTIKSNYIDGGQFQWYGAVCVPCQAELPRPENYEEWERMAAECVRKFENPPKTVEEAPKEEVQMQERSR